MHGNGNHYSVFFYLLMVKSFVHVGYQAENKNISENKIDDRFDRLRQAARKLGNMSEPTSALVPSVDVERPNASEGIATKPVKPESPIRKELEEDESTVEELSAAIDKAEEPGQVSQTAEEEQPKKIDEKATNETTTEDNSSAVDVMENALPSSDAKKEEVTYEIEKVGRHANENAIRDDNESLKNDDGMNSSAKIAENGSVNSNEERISEESVEEKSNSVKDDRGAETDATVEESDTKDEEKKTSLATPVISSSKRSRPSFKYDPNKITLRFLFANKDGLAVTIECNPSDTVGEVKGALISAWPEGMYWPQVAKFDFHCSTQALFSTRCTPMCRRGKFALGVYGEGLLDARRTHIRRHSNTSF